MVHRNKRNKIGKFDPTTEQFEEFDIPTPSSNSMALQLMETVTSGSLKWPAQRLENLMLKLGRLMNLSTPTLNSGPHTPIIGNGVIWFTEIEASKIGRPT